MDKSCTRRSRSWSGGHIEGGWDQKVMGKGECFVTVYQEGNRRGELLCP
jgi:hypothetical protein